MRFQKTTFYSISFGSSLAKNTALVCQKLVFSLGLINDIISKTGNYKMEFVSFSGIFSLYSTFNFLDTFTEPIFVEQLQRASSEGVQLQHSLKMKPRHGVTENGHALRSSFFCQKR